MAITLSEIRVGFHGEGAGAGELTWGQMGIWRNTQRYDGSMNLAWTAPPPEGASLADVVGILEFEPGRPKVRSFHLFWRVRSPLRHGDPRLPCTHSAGASFHRRARGTGTILRYGGGYGSK